MKYDLDTLKKCAHNLMFDMTDEQYEVLLNEFVVIDKQMSLLGKIDGLNEVEPMTFPFDVTTDELREDVAGACLNKEDVLRNAKDTEQGQIRIPKVVG